MSARGAEGVANPQVRCYIISLGAELSSAQWN